LKPEASSAFATKTLVVVVLVEPVFEKGGFPPAFSILLPVRTAQCGRVLDDGHWMLRRFEEK
jgi:hypothetical protein